MNKFNKLNCCICFLLAILFLGCKKAIEVSPPVTSLVSSNVFGNNSTAESALSGVYVNMAPGSTSFGGGTIGISAAFGCSADELRYVGTDAFLSRVYSNNLISNISIVYWNQLYNYIYQVNAILENVSRSNGITSNVKKQLTGEAKFLRALYYFYLVNIFGDVPFVNSTNYIVNNSITRTPSAVVFQNIVLDLKDAQSLLSDGYVDANGVISTDRIRPNKFAATALLARVFLYMNNWSDAEIQSTNVINDSKYVLLSTLNSVFLRTSQEAIWQLQSIVPGYSAYDGYIFILTSAPTSGVSPFYLNTDLLNAFETGDLRKINWISNIPSGGQTYYFPYKYQVKTTTGSPAEYNMVLRLAEQYLIRAEARIMQNKPSDAISDINIIRKRANLSILPSTLATNDIILAIEQERRVELFTEYGARWFDLKRWRGINDPTKYRIDEIMPPVTSSKGASWNAYARLFPIPLSEILINSNLSQNPGY